MKQHLDLQQSLIRDELVLLEVLVEPIHCLQECRLASEFIRMNIEICLQGEAVVNIAVQAQLKGNLHLLEYLLGLMAFVCRK